MGCRLHLVRHHLLLSLVGEERPAVRLHHPRRCGGCGRCGERQQLVGGLARHVTGNMTTATAMVGVGQMATAMATATAMAVVVVMLDRHDAGSITMGPD